MDTDRQQVKVLITFYSVSSALLLERLLPAQEHPRVVTVPRELSTSCGYAATATVGDLERLQALLEEQGLEWHSIYLVGLEGGYRLLVCRE